MERNERSGKLAYLSLALAMVASSLMGTAGDAGRTILGAAALACGAVFVCAMTLLTERYGRTGDR